MKDFFELRENKSDKTEDKGQFIYAAKQAKKKGDSTFVFAGKTYNCEEVLENEDLKESLLNENYRTLARAGMGTESKGEARVGLELDYYDGSGTKRMGKITKVTPKGYMVKDEKDGKVRQFTFHDRAKAKEILARIGKGKYNESVELDENQKLFMFKTKREAEKKAKEVKGKVVSLTKQNFAVVVEEVEQVDLDERKLDVRNLDDQELFKKAVAIAMDKYPKDRKRAEREIAKLDRGKELLSHPTVQTALKRAPYQ